MLGALEEQGEDVDALVRYQMEQFGYSEQLAREEVVANTLPAILNDEAYVKKLVSMDRTLAERIRDFIADFVSFVNETLRALEGEASWKQVRSIREDTEMLSAIGELFDVALEGVPGAKAHSSAGTKFSGVSSDDISSRTNGALSRYPEQQIENWKGSKKIVVYSDFVATCKKSNIAIASHPFGSALNAANAEFSLSKRNEIPNLLSEEFRLA